MTKGPFGTWDGLDLEKYINRMEAEGMVIPAWIKEMFAVGIKSFYKTENGIQYYYSIPDKKYVPVEHKPEVIVLPELKAQNKVVKDSGAATLYDLGDGVLCLEMHSPASAISEELIDFMQAAQEELAKNWEGMVIAGSGKNFCVGANLQLVAEASAAKRWDDLDKALARTQSAFLANKYSEKPVVAAVHGMALGGGCEMTMQSSAAQVAGESYIGQVEVGVGLIPAAGGLKEAVLRTNASIKGSGAAPVDFARVWFQNYDDGQGVDQRQGSDRPRLPAPDGQDLPEPGLPDCRCQETGPGHGRRRIHAAGLQAVPGLRAELPWRT